MTNIGPTAYCVAMQYIEGNRIADLQWGTTNGKYAILRFCATYVGPSMSGTWCVSIRNSPITHSYVINVFVPPNTASNKEYTYIIPPPPSGFTWATDASNAISICFSPAVGANFQTPTASAWVAGNYLATTAITALSSTSDSSLTIGDVGFYADPNMTGRAPEFAVNNYEEDLTECLRYWYPL